MACPYFIGWGARMEGLGTWRAKSLSKTAHLNEADGSAVLCHWGLIENISEEWYLPLPTGRRQRKMLQAIDLPDPSPMLTYFQDSCHTVCYWTD